ncbi:cytochrome P450 [Methanosarcina sp. T3]|uniref:cytochrome P450 n=1 Tax=Methanosarcina sp. T3 TaxID=3439062 RepID=UPI003F84BFEB
MIQQSLYEQVLDYANRANPYPLYARLRQTPVIRQKDGSYVVSTYREIVSLLHDPRIGSNLRKHSVRERAPAGPPANQEITSENQVQEVEMEVSAPDQGSETEVTPSFIGLDPPEHDRLRRQATRPFGPPHTPGRIAGMEPEIIRLANRQIDIMKDKTSIDIVEDFAYPIPVTIISDLLGVPPEDQPHLHALSEAIIKDIDLDPEESPEERKQRQEQSGKTFKELEQYMEVLTERHRKQPGSDLISGLITDHGPDGPMAHADIVSTASLLLIAGHETTVNLITNGVLTLLRHPEVLERLRREPDLVIRLVEELLRYEPPVQVLPNRVALDNITIAGTTIQKGSPVILLLASGSRDPAHFHDPDKFDPDRRNNMHLGFGSGIHYCYGAPLARLETQIALTELVRRLENPRLVHDPPPYRQSVTLRGPRHLIVEIDGVKD